MRKTQNVSAAAVFPLIGSIDNLSVVLPGIDIFKILKLIDYYYCFFYPYLLSNLVGAASAFIILPMVIFWLPETIHVDSRGEELSR